jgi:hypothetical protein
MSGEIPPNDSDLASGAAPEHPDALRRMLLVITQPTAAFRGLATSRLAWLLPALLVALLTVISPQLMPDLLMERQEAMIEDLIDRQLLSEEQAMDARQRLTDQVGDRTTGKVLLQMLLGVVSQVVLRYILPAALLLAGVRFVMEGRAGFSAVLGAVAYSAVPAGIREIIRTPLQLAEGTLDIHFGPAALTGTHTLGGYALGLLDFFDLWIVVLLIVGIATVGPLSRGRAAGLVLPLWILFCLAKIALKASPFGAGL